MMECLGLIKIHSPMRADPNRVVKWVPGSGTIRVAIIASKKLLRRVGAGYGDQLAACSIKKKQVKRKPMENRRKATINHHKYMRGTTMYPLQHSPGHVPSSSFFCFIETLDLVDVMFKAKVYKGNQMHSRNLC